MVATKDTMMTTAKRPVVYAKWLQHTGLTKSVNGNEDLITILAISFDIISRLTARLTFALPIKKD